MWKTPYCYPVKCYTPMDSVLACIFTSFCPLPFLRRHQGRALRLCAPWGRLTEPCAVSRGDEGGSRPLAGNDHTAGRGGIVAEVLRLGSDERALLARPGVDVVVPSLTE